MWEAYKEFCKSRWEECGRACSPFRFFRTTYGLIYTAIMWVLGTVMYCLIACFVAVGSLIQLLVK